MKLHYCKILLFFLTLTIFLTSSSNAHNKNKPSITPRYRPTTTSRVLSESDIKSSNYDKDEEMKSVKENFDRQTSQRLRKYDERLQDKRQKHKEQREKNIQEIIKKDKMDKSLAEKIEKGCLRYGCALGGGVLPVWGLVGGLWYATWSQYVTQKALAAGIQKGITTVVTQLQEVAKEFDSINIDILEMVNAETYGCPQALFTSIYGAKQGACVGETAETAQVCTKIGADNTPFWFKTKVIDATAKGIEAAKNAQAKELAELTAKSSHMYSAIGYSVLAILIIVLIMVIIYLILRYRRKKRMNKKAQYTKLLNQ